MIDGISILTLAQSVSPVVMVIAVLLMWRFDGTIGKLNTTIKNLELTIAKEYATLTALDTVVDRVQFLEQKNMKG